jgi:Phage gp6-like head-tail connector protein
MARIPLATVKEQLRVEGTDTSQDNVLAIYIEAMEEFVEAWCDRKFGHELPFKIQAAVLLGVGDLYENRESINVGNIVNKIPTMESLMQSHRDYGNYFGMSPPPILAELDPEPLYIGDDWSRVWRWKDAAGVAINVTGYTGTFVLYDGDTEIHSGNLTISNAVGGEFAYTIQDAVTTTFASGERWYRVRVSSAGGEVVTLDRKRLNVL